MDTLTLKANIIKFTVISFSKLPFALAQRLGMGLGWLLAIIPNPLRRVATINIQRCFPEKTSVEQKELVRKTFMHLGSNALEHGAWWVWPPEKFAPLVTAVYGEDYIKAAQREGKGVLILVPHLGAWEVLQRYMPRHYTCASMYRPLRISALEDFVKTARTKDGADLLPLTRSGLREAYQRLSNGQVMGVLPDQVPNKNGGVFAPFFAIPAWTTTFAIKMIQKTGVLYLNLFDTDEIFA